MGGTTCNSQLMHRPSPPPPCSTPNPPSSLACIHAVWSGGHNSNLILGDKTALGDASHKMYHDLYLLVFTLQKQLDKMVEPHPWIASLLHRTAIASHVLPPPAPL